MALSSLRQNQRRAKFIDQHDNALAHTALLTVNFQAANIILVLCLLLPNFNEIDTQEISKFYEFHFLRFLSPSVYTDIFV